MLNENEDAFDLVRHGENWLRKKRELGVCSPAAVPTSLLF